MKRCGDKKADVFGHQRNSKESQLAEALALIVGEENTGGEKQLEEGGLARFTKAYFVLHCAFVSRFLLHASVCS